MKILFKQFVIIWAIVGLCGCTDKKEEIKSMCSEFVDNNQLNGISDFEVVDYDVVRYTSFIAKFKVIDRSKLDDFPVKDYADEEWGTRINGIMPKQSFKIRNLDSIIQGCFWHIRTGDMNLPMSGYSIIKLCKNKISRDNVLILYNDKEGYLIASDWPSEKDDNGKYNVPCFIE